MCSSDLEQVDFTAVMVVEKQGFRDMVFGIFQFADDIMVQDAQDFPVDFIHGGSSPCNGGSFWYVRNAVSRIILYSTIKLLF